MNRRLHIAVADDERDTREYFQTVLPSLGYEVVAVAESGHQLIEACHRASPDVVLTDIKMPDMDGIQAAVAINRERPVPVVLVSGYQDKELLERAGAENIMAYLTKPVKASDLVAAITLARKRFEEHQAAREESANLRQALEDRKVIERAKGVVMRRLGVDEATAYRRIQRKASDENQKLVDVARSLLNAESVFLGLDK
jgi:response regulator NasT